MNHKIHASPDNLGDFGNNRVDDDGPKQLWMKLFVLSRILFLVSGWLQAVRRKNLRQLWWDSAGPQTLYVEHTRTNGLCLVLQLTSFCVFSSHLISSHLTEYQLSRHDVQKTPLKIYIFDLEPTVVCVQLKMKAIKNREAFRTHTLCTYLANSVYS